MNYKNNINLDAPRTIMQLHAEMLAADPNCALTLSAIRRMVRTGRIRSCSVGNKRLITHRAVAEFLFGTTDHTNDAPTIDGIRRIEK